MHKGRGEKEKNKTGLGKGKYASTGERKSVSREGLAYLSIISVPHISFSPEFHYGILKIIIQKR